ncbi:hypothetical protein BOX15_Mlig000734g1 [Macrostomum lignano]|uniref:Uncharacterized protein n=3 Tax=Macrostomum lignano TaxID=282301 RepID=A0A267GII4_9PLAT|nr:hypothetical protein BOX15_Mlig000734g1 [Macrostomum lignano]
MSRPQFTQSVLLDADENIADLLRKFPDLGKDGGTVSKDELRDALDAMGAKVSGFQLRDLLNDLMPTKTSFDKDALVTLYCQVKMKQPDRDVKDSMKKLHNPEDKQSMKKISGTGNEWTLHTIGDSERRGYAGWINKMLEKDPDLSHLLPVDGNTDELYEKLGDGLVLCKLINSAVPGTIHEKAMNKLAQLKGGSAGFRMHENLVLAVNSAESIGCCIVNIGANDIKECRPHIILGLIWQIIRIGLMKDITLSQHKELAALLLPGETLEDLKQLSPEELLLRWVNYQLAKAGTDKRVHNFKDDIMDSEAYAHLLSQIAPVDKRSEMRSPQEVLASADRLKRADGVLSNADKLDAAVFVVSEDIAFANEPGRNREKLNMAFVANLFNNYPAMEAVQDVEVEVIEETLEEKTFRNWMNSLGVSPFVKDLYSDLRNGLILLTLMDHIKPGVVPWSKVCKTFVPNKKLFQWQANCNYVIECGRKIGLPMTNIGAEDIRDGDRKLTLGLVFQMMRAYTLSLLMQLTGGTRKIDDDEIIQWANQKLEAAGKAARVKSFKDPSLADGMVILELADAIKPKTVDTSIAAGMKDQLDRARFILSKSRMIGGRIYALPEHVVQVNKNMIMTVFACLMILDFQINKPSA